jgi:hypothetical protein
MVLRKVVTAWLVQVALTLGCGADDPAQPILGVAMIDDGTAEHEVTLDTVECTEPMDSAMGELTMGARSGDYLTQVIVHCKGTALAAGRYRAANPYGTTTNECTLEVPWNRGSYFSFGEGTITHRSVDGVREFSLQAVGARGYLGNADGLEIQVSGTFRCPS